MLDQPKIHSVFERLARLTISVVGDLFLDQYLELDAALTEKSVETGLDAYQVVAIRCLPGAGGTVLNNLAALGVGRLLAVSVIGRDGPGFELRRALEARNVDLRFLMVADDRFTPTYTKPVLAEQGTSRELNRLDTKNRSPMRPALQSGLLQKIEDALAQSDAMIVADQVEQTDCGVVTQAVRARLAELAGSSPHRLVLADSRANIGQFRNVWLKPNLAECRRALGQPAGDPTVDDAKGLAQALSRRSGRPVYCTLGDQGMVFANESSSTHLLGHATKGPIDIVGAGDSAMAGIACGLTAGLSPVDAGALGNLVASITIQQIGTTGTATPQQVIERWREHRA